MNPLKRIRNQNKTRPLKDSDFRYIHDLLMREYGWIPLEDLKRMPMSTFWNLYSVITERKKKEQEEYEKTTKKNNKGRL